MLPGFEVTTNQQVGVSKDGSVIVNVTGINEKGFPITFPMKLNTGDTEAGKEASANKAQQDNENAEALSKGEVHRTLREFEGALGKELDLPSVRVGAYDEELEELGITRAQVRKYQIEKNRIKIGSMVDAVGNMFSSSEDDE